MRWQHVIIPKDHCVCDSCALERDPAALQEWIHETEKRVRWLAMWVKLGAAGVSIVVAVVALIATL